MRTSISGLADWVPAATANRRMTTRPAKPRLNVLRRHAWTAGSFRATDQNWTIGSKTVVDQTTTTAMSVQVSKTFGADSAWAAAYAIVLDAIANNAAACHARLRGISEFLYLSKA